MSKLYEVNKKLRDKYPHLEFVDFKGVAYEATVKSKECGHTWKGIGRNILSRGSRCKVCNVSQGSTKEEVSKILHTKYPDILEIVGDYTQASRTRSTIRYVCGHTKEIIVSETLATGTNSTCSTCKGSRAYTLEEFSMDIHTRYPELEVVGKYTSTWVPVSVRYPCAHVASVIPNRLKYIGQGAKCSICYPHTSLFEQEVYEFIQSSYTGWIVQNDRSILGSKELDIVLPDLGLAFECNGNYFHSDDSGRSSEYHLKKTELVESFGYRLVHIPEDTWYGKKELVKSRIRNLLGESKRIYARQCSIKEVEYKDVKAFLEENHIQGGTNSSINLVLSLSGKDVAVMTFSRARFSNQCEYELVRYCNLQGYTVVGGASKLFKYFIKMYGPKSIVSYSDRSFNSGNLYSKLGFVLDHISEPNYRYRKLGCESLSRYQCQKHLLKAKFPEIYTDAATEGQIMKKAGYHKVYDCGNLVFVWRKPEVVL